MGRFAAITITIGRTVTRRVISTPQVAQSADGSMYLGLGPLEFGLAPCTLLGMLARIATDSVKVCELVLKSVNLTLHIERVSKIMPADSESRRIRARQVGMLMQGYRRAHRGEHRGGKLSQEGLLRLMGRVDDKYLNAYDRSTVARWESGEIRPSKERLEVFARALDLSPVHLQGMLVLAGLEITGEIQSEKSASGGRNGVVTATPTPADSAGDAWVNRPVERSYVGEIIRFFLSRFLLPGLGIAAAGYFLTWAGWSAEWMLTAYVIVVIAAVLTYYFLKLRRSEHLRDLYMVSVFALLTAPLLQAPLIRMDPYGFYNVDSFANTPMPFVLALLGNLLLSLAAGVMYDFLFRWQMRRGDNNPYRRAAWIALPPLAFVYVCGLLFCYVGTWLYLLEVFPVLAGVIVAILVLRDESVRFGERTRWLLIQTSIAITIVLTTVSLAGMVVVYWDPSLLFVPDHTLIRSWEVDFTALGYAPQEFEERARIGVVWSSLAAIIYMVVAIGGSLAVTIYSKGNGDSASAAGAPEPVASTPTSWWR